MSLGTFLVIAALLACSFLTTRGQHTTCFNLCHIQRVYNGMPICRFKCRQNTKLPKGWYSRKIPSAFTFYDTDRNNVITYDELRLAFSSYEHLMKNHGLQWMFKMADTDGNGIIDFKEFKAALWDFEVNDGHARRFRDYYLQAEEILWDYLPFGENLVDNDNAHLEETLRNRHNRIGSKFYKYVYKRYTDNTYSEEIKSPRYQGFVGPLLHAELGDVLRIHLRSLVHAPISIHPHGALYDKLNEGAFYEDNTSHAHKLDDRIPFGHNRTLTWRITAEFSPTADDPPCLCFPYHSHNSAEKEIYSGLLGLLVSCKPGVLTDDIVRPRRRDISAERILFYDTVNEGKSLLTSKNLNLCGNPIQCHLLYQADDQGFLDSLKKDSINGYMYGNMPDLNVCAGERVAWYIFSLNDGIHTAEIHGHQFQVQHHRKSVIGIFSGTFVTATTLSTTPGKWLIACLNLDHLKDGMTGYLNVRGCGRRIHGTLPTHKVTYYLAAESVLWNYAPSGMNKFDGGSLTASDTTSAALFTTGPNRIGGTYIKSKFTEYTDMTYNHRMERNEDEVHLALLGPVLRGVVGDKIRVVLLNKTPFNVSLYMQGVRFSKDQDGLLEKQGVPGAIPDGNIVGPGRIGTYIFSVPVSVSPDEDDPPCKAYIYHSAVDLEKDVNAGLVGPALICKQGHYNRRTDRQRNIDKEIFLLFADMDENKSWYLQQNINNFIPGYTDTQDDGFVASNIMRSINGRSYGNLEGLGMCHGDAVAWHVMSMGGKEGLHGVKFNGNNILTGGVNRDAYVVVPGTTFTGLMHAGNAGNWSISCHNTDHFLHGEKAIYRVEYCRCRKRYCKRIKLSDNIPYGRTLVYYIGAVDRKWNYSPRTIHPLTGEDYSNPSSSQYKRVRTDNGFIGSEYNKALYVEYTDATFTVEKVQDPALGILGPTIHCSVGDTVVVVFKNMASRNFSIHPHGLRYSKEHEGQLYRDGHTSRGDSVAPGNTHKYIWTVPADAGPSKSEANCHGSTYQSAVDPVKDVYTGLVGTLVICKPRIRNRYRMRTDRIRREFFLLMMAWDENQSWYLQKNINEYAPGYDQTTEELKEANKYDAMNGLVFNNLKGLNMCEGEAVAWYGLALGLSEDYHTIHYHGNMYIHRTNRAHRGDVTDVFPGTKETVTMLSVNSGTWLVHCHVGEHQDDGMVATYTVYPKSHPFCSIR